MSAKPLFNVKNIIIVIIFALIISIITLVVNFAITPNYKASTKLLLVFNQQNIDTYTAAKNANYITGILSEVVYSNSFINQVISENKDIKDNFGYDNETRLKKWNKAVKIKVIENKGIFAVDVYDNDRDQAVKLASTIDNILVNKHNIYDGSDQNAQIKVIDSPSIYDGWYASKLIRDSLIALLVGLLIGITFIVIFPYNHLFDWLDGLFAKSIKKDEILRLNSDYFVPGSDNFDSESETFAGASSFPPAEEGYSPEAQEFIESPEIPEEGLSEDELDKQNDNYNQ